MNKSREEWERHCIQHLINNSRRFSVWWATDNKFVSNAMDRLIKNKRIEVIPLQFPMLKAKIKKRGGYANRK